MHAVHGETRDTLDGIVQRSRHHLPDCMEKDLHAEPKCESELWVGVHHLITIPVCSKPPCNPESRAVCPKVEHFVRSRVHFREEGQRLTRTVPVHRKAVHRYLSLKFERREFPGSGVEPPSYIIGIHTWLAPEGPGTVT